MAGLVTTEGRSGAYYFPLAQDPSRHMDIAIRTAGEPTALAAAARGALAAIDPELPLFGIMTMEERMSETLVDRRTPMVLALGFATVALFLAAIGIYGVLAFQVSQRTREIGIRMALGSDAAGIFRLVIKEGLGLLMVGLAVGLAGAFAIRRAMETQLYGTSGMDPIVVLVVGSVLGVVALAACTVPARRAARIDPTVALGD